MQEFCFYFLVIIINLCSFFYREKRTKKATSFCQKEAKTTPFRFHNSVVYFDILLIYIKFYTIKSR